MRIHDPSHEMLQIESFISEVVRQCVKKCRVRRRVRRPEIIHWMYNATTEKLPPDAIDHGTGKERIFRLEHPVGQCLPRIYSCSCDKWLASQRCGLHHLVADRMPHRATRCMVDILGACRDRWRDTCAFALSLGEKGGELIKISLAPPLVRMVMATCAIHSHAKKGLAEQRGQSRRFAAGASGLGAGPRRRGSSGRGGSALARSSPP